MFNFFNKIKSNTPGVELENTQSKNASSDYFEKKNAANIEKVKKICLEKPQFTGLRAEVKIIWDHSGSMGSLYNNGTIQECTENILPLGLQFDDNGSVEVAIFDDGFKILPDLTLNNVHGYISREVNTSYGWTYYSPILKDLLNKVSNNNLGAKKLPKFVIFITDGECMDSSETANVIRSLSHYPVFIQFIGIGGESFKFLKHLDTMTGRFVDNASFFEIKDPSKITYQQLTEEFANWLSNDKVKEMLK